MELVGLVRVREALNGGNLVRCGGYEFIKDTLAKRHLLQCQLPPVQPFPGIGSFWGLQQPEHAAIYAIYSCKIFRLGGQNRIERWRLARFVGYTGEILDFGVGLRLANSGAQRKITDYYKKEKKVLQETTTRQDTQQDKKLMKDTRTRQEIQDKALHRRTTPSHREAKPKSKQERGDYNRRIPHDVHERCTARMRTGVDLTLTTVKVTAMSRNTTKGAQRMVTFTAGMIQAVKVDLQPG
jgi:hypothetical protein